MKPRARIKDYSRFLIKIGSGVLTDEHGGVSIGRIGDIVQQVAHLKSLDKEVILVSSGSIAVGRQKLLGRIDGDLARVYAAAGQSGLMSLYESMFLLKGLTCAQVLVTDEDFQYEERRLNLKQTLQELLRFGAVPVINENDVISTRADPLTDANNKIFWDNDSLACLIAGEVGVDCLIILTDVDGLYKQPPSEGRRPEVIHTLVVDEQGKEGALSFSIGRGSKLGRGGMAAKIDAAMRSLSGGVKCTLVANGFKRNVVRDIVEGKQVGTLVVPHLAKEEHGPEVEDMARMAREAAANLIKLSAAERSDILKEIATKLLYHRKRIVNANQHDLEAARRTKLAAPLLKRLSLDEGKLRTLATGIRQLADMQDPIGEVLQETEITDGLTLQRKTVPLGVLLVIFESRPDVLPQVASLALRSGNAVLMKGGKEAKETNKVLVRLISEAVERVTEGRVSGWIVGLVDTREAIKDLLRLRDHIDLVIPRGSGSLVRYVEDNTRIPVMGHSEGLCHIFVDASASYEKTLRIVVESKLDYPAACNAVETLLIHRSVWQEGFGKRLVRELLKRGVAVNGDGAVQEVEGVAPMTSFKEEYGDSGLTCAVVQDLGAAVQHINRYGSHHTDCIVTEDESGAATFIRDVDSACAFHNASTRFADGYRFGLGAEVGISTGKIWRGPVGIDGLMTTKWVLKSSDAQLGHTIGDCEERPGGGRKLGYTHRKTKSKL